MHRSEPVRNSGRWRVCAALFLTGALPISLVIAISVMVQGDSSQGELKPPQQPLLDTAGHFFLGVAAVLLASYGMGVLAERLGQPRVIGEIAAGILLGPTLLGSVAPGVMDQLFPERVVPMFNGLAQLGLVLFMFGVGQELGSMQLRGAARQAMAISQASLLVPFAAGVLVALPLVDRYMPDGTRPVAFVLFVGCALSITAFPVLARILSDLNLSRTRPGRLSLFAAAVGDGGSWLALAVVLSLSHGSDPLTVLARAVAVVAVTMLFVGPLRRLLAQGIKRVPSGMGTASGVMLFLVVGVGVSATLTAVLGIHQLIGALLVGLIWPHEHQGATAAVRPLATTAKTVLLPFFFLGFGLTVDLGSLHLDGAAGIALLSLLAAATLAKIAGPSLAAWLTGLPWRESCTVGVLLNARGLTELVVLQIGYEAHLINAEMLGLLTVVALVTTVMTSPLLRCVGHPPGAPQGPADPPSAPADGLPVGSDGGAADGAAAEGAGAAGAAATTEAPAAGTPPAGPVGPAASAGAAPPPTEPQPAGETTG
ncbi:cation:proton antiporter [Streptomyces sp. 796.1]|uniref:cation:proton antiporter n=1 Tax=Streptomyces sp. 796.1 TaxID=3163029 RepID=UPI0039C8ECEA